jgi:hypothetical protein
MRANKITWTQPTRYPLSTCVLSCNTKSCPVKGIVRRWCTVRKRGDFCFRQDNLLPSFTWMKYKPTGGLVGSSWHRRWLLNWTRNIFGLLMQTANWLQQQLWDEPMLDTSFPVPSNNNRNSEPTVVGKIQRYCLLPWWWRQQDTPKQHDAWLQATTAV